MAAEIHQEGLQYLLECALSEEQTPPTSVYVGLCTDASLAEDASLTDLTEVSGTGYGREAVTTNSTDITSASAGTNDWRATLKQVTFSASGTWTGAQSWFIATVATGTAGKLLSSGPLSQTRTLGSGDELNVDAYLQLNG